METLSKTKQEEIANEIFKLYPKAQKVAITSDGQAFIIDNGDAAAKNHAKNNLYKKELEINTFVRDAETADVDKKQRKTAAELIAEIELAETKEAVNAILNGDTRSTVIAAAQKRIETLLIAEIELAETEEAVNAILNGDTRSTVIAAAQKKIETFKK